MKQKRILSFLLSIVMVITLIPAQSFAKEADDFKVVVSMEGLTLGQGFYVEPKAYSLDEINELIAEDGYGPYTEEDLTAGMATLAFLKDNGLDYNMTGSWDNGAYLSSVAGIDKGTVDIPSFISENGGPSNEDNEGNDDDYLGEFDYSSMSGWMITVNDFMIDVGCAAWILTDEENKAKCPSDLENTYVVRWQFTLWGYGADLGVDTGWGMPALFEGANKAELYAAFADSKSAKDKESALAIMENLTASQDEVNEAVEVLSKEATESAPLESEAKKPASETYKAVLNDTMAKLSETVSAPSFGTGAGEWSVLSLARGGFYPIDNKYFEDYYSRIEDTVKTTAASVNLNGALHKTKSTENSRLIMALSSIGRSARNVGGVDLVGAYDENGMTWIKKQGINGPIFALIALDTGNYATKDETLRKQCVDFILSKELAGGGWALSGTAADPDITSMALQALVNYKDDERVLAAADKAFSVLSSMQKENGGFASWGSVNSESIAQVIVACTAWGINPDTDARFKKSEGTAVDALLSFYVESGKGFAHVLQSGGGYTGGEVNGMATDQACYALVAFDRFLNSKTSLYDMSDVMGASTSTLENPEPAASISLPEKVENKAGVTFNAVVNLDGFASGYRLIDGIVNVPKGIKVKDVKIGSRIEGGELSYFLEEETGKLRFAYFDASEGKEITASGNVLPLEFMTISLEVTEEFVKANEGIENPTITLTISGMTFKKDSKAEGQLVVDIKNASAQAAVVEGITYSVMALYTGDGIDIIPTEKTAIAVSVTGVEKGAKISFEDETGSVSFRYSELVSNKSGVSTYVAMISSNRELAAFTKEENFTVTEGETADALIFGDVNSDNIINAQDALNTVNFWLRKKTVSADTDILKANVNGDSRLNTSDALGIVEHFVDGTEFAIVNKAATLKKAK